MFWYLELFWQWYLFFTVNLNSYQHKLFFEKIKQLKKKDNPFFHRFSSLKTQCKTWKQFKLSDIAFSVRNCCLKGHLSPPPTFFVGKICSIFRLWHALVLSSDKPQVYPTWHKKPNASIFQGVSKNIDLKNLISTTKKSERFTERTGFDLYPLTPLLYFGFQTGKTLILLNMTVLWLCAHMVLSCVGWYHMPFEICIQADIRLSKYLILHNGIWSISLR